MMPLLTLMIATLLALTAEAVSNYQRCFQCFSANRVGYNFCEPTGECLRDFSLDCDEQDKIKTYWDCPQRYVPSTCGNYTFTEDDFEMSGENALTKQMRLNQGEACVMSIDRTTDGSFGSVRIQYDNPYIMVFDEYDWIFLSNDYLGLLEESSVLGWAPRTFLVANAGLMPT